MHICRVNTRRSASQVRAFATALIILLVTLGSSGVALAQEAGTSAAVVLSDDAGITIDGQLDEWSDLPAIVTVSGPAPSDDPGANGRLRWQVASDQTTVFFAATITDEVIVAGQNGSNYWNEDSLEFYLNFSGDLAATEYIPGVAQVRIAAVDIGQTDAGALTLTGNGVDQVGVTGFVFETADGWGTEIAIDVSTIATPATGDRFGLQIQANGSSGGDRDLKLSWSARDTEDTAFADPSVFAQGVFTSGVVEAAAGSDDAPATVGPAGAGEAAEGLDGAEEVDSIIDGGPEIITGDEQRRSLLIAAVVSSIFVFFGGLFFERKRKADEARHKAEQVAAAKAAAENAEIEGRELLPADDAEFDAMLGSILDEDGSSNS